MKDTRGAGSAVWMGVPIPRHPFKWTGPRYDECDLCEECGCMDVDYLHSDGAQERRPPE